MERSGNFYKAIQLGYILISILIGCMAYNSLYEWQEIEALELGNKKIDELRKEINNINIQMIKFSLLGETILEWNDKDIEHYHARRMAMDSMLCRFKATYPAERIDSVRSLLEDKERQMFQIVRLMDEQQSINKKIANQIPVIVQKSVQEQSKKPKRKGFLGIFGKKEGTKPTTTTTTLRSSNRNMVNEQKAQSRRLSEQADSLAARNAELNRQLQGLICQIEKKVQSDLQNRESEITAMRKKSFMQIGGLMGFVLLLLVISYIIIHRDAKNIKRYKRKTTDLIEQLEQSVQQNEVLITSRKKAVHTITHELRTPLTAITGYTELLRKECNSGNNGQYIRNILQSSDRMRDMLNTLLDFFRLDNGKEQPRLSPSDTTLADVRKFGEECQRRWGITPLQIFLHKDEGHWLNGQPEAEDRESFKVGDRWFKPNYHAHIVFDWMNHETGKSRKLNDDDMMQMQTLASDILLMERGQSKAVTGKEHLERNDFIIEKQKAELQRMDAAKRHKEEQINLAEQELKQVKSEIRTDKLKKTATTAATAITSGVASLFGSGKLKELERANEKLQDEVSKRNTNIEKLQSQVQQMQKQHDTQIHNLREMHRQELDMKEKELSRLARIIDKAFRWFPMFREMLRMEKFCAMLGFSKEMTESLIVKKEALKCSGKIYSEQHRRNFDIKDDILRVENDPDDESRLNLTINRKPIADWFREQWHRLRYGARVPQQEERKSRGFKL